MDVKIGAKTYGPMATPAKIAQEDAKYLGTKKPLGKKIGFIIFYLIVLSILIIIDLSLRHNISSRQGRFRFC